MSRIAIEPHRLHIGDADKEVAFITSTDTGYDIACLRRYRDEIPEAQRLTDDEWQALINRVDDAIKGVK